MLQCELRFSINLSFLLDYLVINFSLYIVGLQSIYFHSVLLINNIQTHSSTLIFHMDDLKIIHRYKLQLITAHSIKNRRTFLTNCIQEKVIPTSVLHPSQHIFPDYIHLYLQTSIRDLKFSEAHTFEKARLIGLKLR